MSQPLEELAEALSTLTKSPLSHDVLDAARRTLLNVLATTVGAAHQPATDIVVRETSRIAPGGAALVPGRTERLHPLDAAVATGVAAHLDDFDDTHLRTVIHPGAVELSTLVALQENLAEADANTVLHALAWGVEVQLRLGNAISPEHYDAGWHITGTCGPIGAAVTAAIVLDLPPDTTATALALAVEGAVGNREGFGSMTKPFHPAQAAVRGLRAVDAAVAGVPSPGDSLTGASGLATRLAGGTFRPEELFGDLGERWELFDNAFKPYPCGIVTHPAIEAAEKMHEAIGDGPGEVEEIVLRCHPLVPELTGNIAPVDGLQARFSTAHGVAAGLLLGEVGLPAYDDAFVVSDHARRVRGLVRFEATSDCDRDAATLRLRRGGRWHESVVAHARGSLARPLTDEELLAKARGLLEPVLPGGAQRLDSLSRATGRGYLSQILAACVPTPTPRASIAGPDRPEPGIDDASRDLELARLLATGAATAVPVVPAPVAALLAEARGGGDSGGDSDGDPRDRAARVAEKLGGTGRPDMLVAAAAAATTMTDDDEAAGRAVCVAGAVALEVARRLEVSTVTVARLAAGLAAATAGALDVRAVRDAIGLVATQTTGVTGPGGDPDLSRRRLGEAAADGIAAALLARGGFSGPARPLTGRRGLLSLLAVVDAEESLVEPTRMAIALREVVEML